MYNFHCSFSIADLYYLSQWLEPLQHNVSVCCVYICLFFILYTCVLHGGLMYFYFLSRNGPFLISLFNYIYDYVTGFLHY